ncbi:MAG: Zn-dependent alcohol dehydrogenase [Dehalococcoidia bacterium]
MKAAVLYAPNTPLVIEEIDLYPLGPGDVLVRVASAGVCHSDLHHMDGHSVGHPRPVVLGHEGAGIVEEVAPDVGDLAPGDHVIFSFRPSCGTCPDCAGGRPNLCMNGITPGHLASGRRHLHKDGSEIYHFANVSCFAEKAVVRANSLVKIPDEMPLDAAALVGCCVMTGVGAVINTAKVRPGSKVVVIGTGGVGLNVIQGAKLAGAARIIAVDLLPYKLEQAERFGATHMINATTEDVVSRVWELTNNGADYAFEVIGSPDVVTQALNCVRPGGMAVAVGVPPTGAQITISAAALFPNEKILTGSFYGSTRFRTDMPMLVDLYLNGRLMIDELITGTYPLDQINEAFAKLSAGEAIRGILNP